MLLPILPLVATLATALALLGTAAPSAAQVTGASGEASPASEAFVHESWTVGDGLPVNSITSVLQSRDGYLWIATFDGLVRFDGARFTVFNASNSQELPSSRVIDLLETRDGALWLRTEQNQLVRFRGGTFTHFGRERGLSQGVLALFEDRRGRLWVGTEAGLGRIDGDRFVPVAAAAVRGTVNAILERRDGTLWVGLKDGRVMRIEGETATEIAPPSRSPGPDVIALHEDPAGTLWIGTSAGIWRHREVLERVIASDGYRFHSTPGTGELWILTSVDVHRMGAQGTLPVVPRTEAVHRPQRLVPDGEGRVLYSSGAELHREGRRIYTLRAAEGGRLSEAEAITAILPDREGSIWLGTFAAGLHRLKPADFAVYGEPEGLSHHNVYGVYEDRNGAVWVGTLEGGTNRIAGGRVERMMPAGGFPLTAYSFLEDRSGRLWIGGGDGLHLCATPGGPCARQGEGPVSLFAVRAIHEEPDGALWFGSETGLFRLEGGRWRRLTAADGAPDATVRAFQRTRDGALWMGTDGGGLARYHAGRFTRVGTAEGLPLDLVRALYEDEDGWLWVGTEGRGLARLDPREWGPGRGGGRIVTYRVKDGLFDDGIHQILEDGFGRLWMSTNRGIFWVRRQELVAFAEGRSSRVNSIGYTERDGLRNREANGGSQPAGVRSRDGRLWFATQDGVAVVDPARVQQNLRPPPVVIEQVTGGGKVLPVGPGSALRLGVEQRDLEIDFTALSLLAPANVRFRYRLEPYDRDWVEAGGRRTAFYTQVPPGRYTFQVIASNNDGVWNEEGATLELELVPHYWETDAFRLLGLMLLGLLLAGGAGWRNRSLRERTRELARLVDERTAALRQREAQLEAQNAQLGTQAEQLQEVDRAKSRFFANVSHEFRTPLTLIQGPLEGLLAGRYGPLAAGVRGQHELMLRNARRLLRMVNQILDLAKLESHDLALDARPRDLVAFVREVTLAFAPLAERRQIRLGFRSEVAEAVVRFDAEQLEKVLLNLLSNALKFTDADGEVEVVVRAEDASACVAVRDTGAGIPPEALPRVFERFFQVDNSSTRRHAGTGIGLALVKELVERHGGRIRAESTPGAGSTFTVTLPLAPPGRGSSPVHAGQLQREEAGEHGRGATGNGQHGTVAHTHSPVPRFETGESGGLLAASLPGEGAPYEPGEEPARDDEDRTTVLVVDDNADVRLYIRSVLAPAYRVLEAADGLAGLELARRALPDLLVTDVMMPGMDGLDLVRSLRESAETEVIPVILLTARATTGDQVEGLRSGAEVYLAKPFDPAVLEAQVAALLEQQRRLRARLQSGELPLPEPSAPSEPTLLTELRAALVPHLADPDFSPEALAAAVGLSYAQLYRRLRDEHDLTPSRLLRTLRVEHAAELLRQGRGSITEVAYSVGFNSLSYFHRAFRERFGAAPSDYLPADR